MNQKIRDIISAVLSTNIRLSLDEDINPTNITEWDSMNHLIIVTALEEEFNLNFTPENIEEMYKGYSNIQKIISSLIGE